MMKWNGWGDPDKFFSIEHRPDLWPWMKTKFNLDEARETTPIALENVVLDAPKQNDGFVQALRSVLADDQLLATNNDRLLHSFGKSFPDLFHVRQGRVERAPDLVVLPQSHDEVEHVVAQAAKHGASVIPFGGGTNIVGAINPQSADRQFIASLDLSRMNRLLDVDEHSLTATLECGALGPRVEELLGERGFALGHFPDSFEFSTLGGWLATRSAGMQSDAYGNIEDMLVSLRMVTPKGTITTKPVPRASTGPDVNHLALGSEGVLGVITEATMRVHRAPAMKVHHAFLFRSFEDGVGAMHTCLRRGIRPSLFRLSDCEETELSFHMKSRAQGLKALIHRGVKRWLARRGYTQPTLMIVGFEGNPDEVTRVRRAAFRVLKANGGFHLGTKPGETWSKEKFNLPYLRDWVMDRGVMVDVAETSAPWSKVLEVHAAANKAIRNRFQEEGASGYLGCHISHTYETGACLYFTFATLQEPGHELDQYYRYKRLITDVFLEHGAALSHHHAIGIEHRPWMTKEHSAPALRALNAIKQALDPDGIMNPGKLLPEESRQRTSS